MNRFEYLEEIKEAVKDCIENEIDITEFEDKEELETFLNDELWACDSVTGNGSGSYYYNAFDAEEAVSHAWDVLQEALEEFGETDINVIEKGAEWCDVTIRCYLLSEAIAEVLKEIEL